MNNCYQILLLPILESNFFLSTSIGLAPLRIIGVENHMADLGRDLYCYSFFTARLSRLSVLGRVWQKVIHVNVPDGMGFTGSSPC